MNPAAMAFSLSPDIAWAVRAMIGTAAVSGSPDQGRRLPAVYDRQVHVEQDDVGCFTRRFIDTFLTIRGHRDLKTAPLETPGQEIPDLRMIFDEQDLHRRSLLGKTCSLGQF